MMMMLPSVALALLSLLQVGAEVPVQQGFDSEKFAGIWYVAAIASNCSVFLKMKDGMKASIITISFTPEGDLDMKLILPMEDKCQKYELLFQRTGHAGHYVGTSEEVRDLRVMETDYSSYAVVHELNHSKEEPHRALQLLTREQDASPQFLQKFEELMLSVGLTKEMEAILPKTGECWEDTWGGTR
ncbi:LCN15 protein, partial [Turnix velox]|nr:LCN15 protein [Turnix velox]